MTKEEKELLFKDLCARLPYGIKCWYQKTSDTCDIHAIWDDNVRIYHNNKGKWEIVEVIKPYLRPMSSITDKEATELGKLTGAASYNLLKTNFNSLQKLLEFVYQRHIDMFSLIEKGLAFEAPESMYNI